MSKATQWKATVLLAIAATVVIFATSAFGQGDTTTPQSPTVTTLPPPTVVVTTAATPTTTLSTKTSPTTSEGTAVTTKPPGASAATTLGLQPTTGIVGTEPPPGPEVNLVSGSFTTEPPRSSSGASAETSQSTLLNSSSEEQRPAVTTEQSTSSSEPINLPLVATTADQTSRPSTEAVTSSPSTTSARTSSPSSANTESPPSATSPSPPPTVHPTTSAPITSSPSSDSSTTPTPSPPSSVATEPPTTITTTSQSDKTPISAAAAATTTASPALSTSSTTTPMSTTDKPTTPSLATELNTIITAISSKSPGAETSTAPSSSSASTCAPGPVVVSSTSPDATTVTTTPMSTTTALLATTAAPEYEKHLKRRSDIPDEHSRDLVFAVCHLKMLQLFDVYDWVYNDERTFRATTAAAVQSAINSSAAITEDDVFFLRGSPLSNRKFVLFEFGVLDSWLSFGVHLIRGELVSEALSNENVTNVLSKAFSCDDWQFMVSYNEALVAAELSSRPLTALAMGLERFITIMVLAFVAVCIVLFAIYCYFHKKGKRSSKSVLTIGSPMPSTHLKSNGGGHAAIYDLNSAADILRDEEVGVGGGGGGSPRGNDHLYYSYAAGNHGHNHSRCLADTWVVPMKDMESIDLSDDKSRTFLEAGESVDTKL